MNCQNFETIVNDLARNQMMEASVREQAKLHSSSCGSCAARLQEEHVLSQGLRELMGLMRDDGASVESEARVLAAFRDQRTAPARVSKVSPAAGAIAVNRGSRRYWNYAAAAGVLLAVALGIAANRFWRSENVAVPVAKTSGNAPEVKTVDSSPLVKLGPELTTIRVKPVPRKSSAKPGSAVRTLVAKQSGNTVTVQSLNILAPAIEVTTDFIPIGYSNAGNVQEGGQIVRLEMPRYAMARFGVPINEERYGEMVKADVWVGADGLARAIRFVQ